MYLLYPFLSIGLEKDYWKTEKIEKWRVTSDFFSFPEFTDLESECLKSDKM